MDSRKATEETFVLFPLLTLSRCHALRLGTIGPAGQIVGAFPALSGFVDSLRRILVDDVPIEDPILAASSADHSKFLADLECLAFVAASQGTNPAADEVFAERVVFTTHTGGEPFNDGEKVLGVNGHTFMSVATAAGIRMRGFPGRYQRWDRESLSKFENELEATLSASLYHALTRCLDDTPEQNVQRERNRILVSVLLHNQAIIQIPYRQPFSLISTVLLAAALEALLNLPAQALLASFRHAVTTLLGDSSRLLNHWCEEFYNYRSALVHGADVWSREEKTFGLSGTNGPPHSYIAISIFVECLRTKLFLMGLYPEYTRAPFEIERLLREWGSFN